ncbi:YbhN family protein [Corynebacterium sp.]|uniref:lysylphosphatidylglycerol synthase transmembrane domain-containing protein n=1 Tax=Corynebacterium sp. TaxID=1720 RepID=UPI0026DF1D66|nr:YbhN family protein [Corynebacterium sp.]MDO5511250.1 YbhN family protein [Corynebacterium sp.]
MWRWVRWLAPLVVLIILGLMFRDQMPFIGDGVRRLRDASPWAVVAAVACALVSIVAMAEVMRLLLGSGGTHVPLRDTTAITLASNSWSTSLPGGPAFSAVLTYQVQRSWGASRLLCGWFFVLSSAVSTMWLVVIGVAGVFFLGADVNVFSLLLTLALMTALSWALWWAANHPATLERWARQLLTRLSPDKVEAVVDQIHQLETVRLNRRRFALVAGWSLLNRAADVLTLFLCVWAVTDSAPAVAGVLLAYTTAKIAGSAQVTPGGLGTVEAAIIAVLVAAGLTAVDATGAALVYRLVSFALITAVGWVVYFLHYARRGVHARG